MMRFGKIMNIMVIIYYLCQLNVVVSDGSDSLLDETECDSSTDCTGNSDGVKCVNNACGCVDDDDCEDSSKPMCKSNDICGEGGCLSENDYVIKHNKDDNSISSELLANIVIGDYIFDGDIFTKVLTVEYGQKQNMWKLFLSNIDNISDNTHNTTVTMTLNHLLYNLNDELIQSHDIKIGDIIFNNYLVNKIENDAQYSSTPVTFSGKLQVNGIKVSSYTIDKQWAKTAHTFTSIFRWLSENVNQYVAGKLMEWLTLDAPNKYYLPLRQILGEEIVHNQFYFNCIAVIVAPIIIIKHLLVSMQIIPVIFAVIIITSIKYWITK